jgi:hypothetical protein
MIIYAIMTIYLIIVTFYWITYKPPKKNIIIGITGRKRSGKDTIANYLVKKYGFVKLAFADSLKESCKIIFGFSDDQVYGDEKDVIDSYWGHSPREILQNVGTELFRKRLPELCPNTSPEIWIKSVDRKIQQLKKSGHTLFVISDIRFQNELDYVVRNNGVSFRVIRPSLLHDSNSNHESEIHVDNLCTDYDFNNNGSKTDLYQLVDKCIKKFFAE